MGFQVCTALILALPEQSISILLQLFSSYLAVTLFTVLLVLVPFLNYKAARSQISAPISQKFSLPKLQQTPTVFLLQDVAPPP